MTTERVVHINAGKDKSLISGHTSLRETCGNRQSAELHRGNVQPQKYSITSINLQHKEKNMEEIKYRTKVVELSNQEIVEFAYLARACLQRS